MKHWTTNDWFDLDADKAALGAKLLAAKLPFTGGWANREPLFARELSDDEITKAQELAELVGPEPVVEYELAKEIAPPKEPAQEFPKRRRNKK